MQKIIKWRGVRLNQRTIDMILAAEKILGYKLRLTQGSYNAGGVAGSAGTHDGGGAADIALKDANTGKLFPKVRREAIRAATRQVGFASWIRDPSQADWPWHDHCIAVGDKDLSLSAAHQVTAYKNNRNGLVSNLRDDGPRTWVNVTWEIYKKAHPDPVKPPTKPVEEDVMTPAQMNELKLYVKGQIDESVKENKLQFIWILRYGLQTEDERKRYSDKYDEVKAGGGTDAQAHDVAWASLAPLMDGLNAAAAALQ